MVSEITRLLLCNYDDLRDNFGTETLKQLWSGEWQNIIKKNTLLHNLLDSKLTSAAIADILNDNQSKQKQDEALCLSISVLLLFCELNWCPGGKDEGFSDVLGVEWSGHIDAASRLQCDSEEVDVNIRHPELLLMAKEILGALCIEDESLLHLWWRLRCLVTQQRVLESASPSLYAELELLAAKLSNLTQCLQDCPDLLVLLLVELCQAFLVYGRVQRAEELLERAKTVAGLKLELRGVLGKRTKFQQRALPQLALCSEPAAVEVSAARRDAAATHGSTALPPRVALQDDVRLESVAYDEPLAHLELTSLEQLLCLVSVQYLEKSQPKDNLADEELHPYLETVLSQQHGPWAAHVAASLFKCKLEAGHKRTVERAMAQCEALVNEPLEAVSSVHRLSYLWGSGLAPAYCRRQQLADLHLSLGLVKAALEQYLALQLWEDVIVCYTMLQLRHKAAEIIQQQIDIKPSAKLYCLLGDATDDVACYERAWEFSEHRSSRAQRHWGNYLFHHKQYRECIPHFEKSLEINSLQERVWLRLGYAALETEQWETSATAYRRYTYLQPNTFEAWNNLAKVYVKQGDKPRAYRALMEALKFNYDNWKLWENVVAVSADTGHFEDVMRGCHRLLDLRGGFRDVEVLTLLVRSVLRAEVDADGNSAARLQNRLLELFGRLTSAHPTDSQLWRLYADISPTQLLRAQRLQKAYRGFTQASEWSNNPETCKQVVELTESLLDCSLQAKKEADDATSLQALQQLSSARLTGQAVVRAAEKQAWPEVQASLDVLKKKYEEVMEFVKL